MRKISPSDDLKRDHWESTVVICWKDPEYLPDSYNKVDTPVLCKIKSNTSRLNKDDFKKVAPPSNFWRTQYYVAQYKVIVNIEVAAILFEVWCNKMKLSHDQRISVQWGKGAEMPRPIDVGKVRDQFSY